MLIPHDEDGVDPTGSGDVDLTILEATMVRPTRPGAAPPQSAKPPACAPKARDMVRDIKARLRVVNAEIRARKTLERERDQLQRLLTAAKTKPATVRAIRSTG